jgi:hypothetical protein
MGIRQAAGFEIFLRRSHLALRRCFIRIALIAGRRHGFIARASFRITPRRVSAPRRGYLPYFSIFENSLLLRRFRAAIGSQERRLDYARHEYDAMEFRHYSPEFQLSRHQGHDVSLISLPDATLSTHRPKGYSATFDAFQRLMISRSISATSAFGPHRHGRLRPLFSNLRLARPPRAAWYFTPLLLRFHRSRHLMLFHWFYNWLRALISVTEITLRAIMHLLMFDGRYGLHENCHAHRPKYHSTPYR